jgi:hypothetical protein
MLRPVADDRTLLRATFGIMEMFFGCAMLLAAIVFFVQDAMGPRSHWFGPALFGLLLAPPGVFLIVSGLAMKNGWRGWVLLQLAPFAAVAAILVWLRSMGPG